MNLFEFTGKFPDEASCVAHFKKVRDKLGIKCKKCGGTAHYWKKDRESYQCKKCGSRITLKSGTIMENSNLPFLYWFKAMHLLTTTRKTFSALEVQKQLKHKSYEAIWNMLHKIREAMGKRDSQYKLTEYIELDDGFFETVDLETKDEVRKRGRGSQKQSKVLVLIESKPVNPCDKDIKYKHKPNRKVGHVKMIVMENLGGEKIKEEIGQMVESGTSVISDAYSGYNKLKEIMKAHEIVNTSEIKEAHTVLPWVHSAIGNAKKVLQGLHHSIGKEHLQSYLNEFCYNYNRRYFEDIFDRLLIACIEFK
ncbi:MAG: IS1595 family transposase [Cyclobacteriaceae bacterium]|nr:IS1595 family transposase [Cyclobacteriaceae bacterium]